VNESVMLAGKLGFAPWLEHAVAERLRRPANRAD